MFDVLFIMAGFAGLLLGGNLLVQGAAALAQRLGVPPMVIGLTLVGFGTSTPELVTSVQAAFAGAPGIAVGNVVGSNIANALLILGIAAVILPIAITPAAFRRDGSVLAIVTLAAVALLLWGEIGRVAGAVLLAALVVYTLGTLRVERRSASAARALYEAEAAQLPASAPATPAWRDTVGLVGGIVVTILSAGLLVDGAIGMATALSVPEAVIGLTIVAVGTSLPELVTSAVAARRGQSDIALGNVIGSNIFNILGILGVTALLRPMEVPTRIAAFDGWAMLAATAAILLVARTGWRIGRREGAVLLTLYGAYLAVQVVNL
jgi:cation:H+ antiporter